MIAPGQVAPAGYWRCHSCAPRPDVLEPKGNRAGREHTRVSVGATRLRQLGQTNGLRLFCAQADRHVHGPVLTSGIGT